MWSFFQNGYASLPFFYLKSILLTNNHELDQPGLIPISAKCSTFSSIPSWNTRDQSGLCYHYIWLNWSDFNILRKNNDGSCRYLNDISVDREGEGAEVINEWWEGLQQVCQTLCRVAGWIQSYESTHSQLGRLYMVMVMVLWMLSWWWLRWRHEEKITGRIQQKRAYNYTLIFDFE